jgi:hypothetical protein
MKAPIICVIAVGIAIAAILTMILMIPTKWDNATVLRICRDGTPIVQLSDGSVWALRSGLLVYRVERKPEEVCE